MVDTPITLPRISGTAASCTRAVRRFSQIPALTPIRKLTANESASYAKAQNHHASAKCCAYQGQPGDRRLISPRAVRYKEPIRLPAEKGAANPEATGTHVRISRAYTGIMAK